MTTRAFRTTIVGAIAAATALTAPPVAMGAGDGYEFSSASASLSTAQAGAHPDLVTQFSFPTVPGEATTAVAHTKEVQISLPPGLVGNPAPFPQCPMAEFSEEGATAASPGVCPQDSQVGTVLVTTNLTAFPVLEPLYNLPPSSDGSSVARLGFIGLVDPFIIDLNVRSGSDYGITADVQGTGAVTLTNATTTIWGVPADPSHDPDRFTPQTALVCTLHLPTCPAPQPSGLAPTAFLTNSTSCGPEQVGFSAQSFENPGVLVSATAPLADITGCGNLPFAPTLTAQPTTTAAASPSGIDVDLSIPQDGLTSATSLGTADLKNAVVTLPPGLTLNPAAADGLGACSEAEIGLTSDSPISFNTADPTCPDASKVGTVQITTPVLADPLEGSLYLADQSANPFHTLLAGYLVAKGNGVIIKLAGRFDLNPQTGQITATFNNNPQLPFSDLKLHFEAGDRGVLATPTACGTYPITSQLTPWSGGPAVNSSNTFSITSGCAPSAFSPTFTAGTQDPQAGRYSPFVLSFRRSATEQNLTGLSVQLPPGILAKLAGVQECSDAKLAAAAANTGAQELANSSCPAGSQVGTVTTGVGVGPNPLILQGTAYLTGSYKGAPYGLAVVVPAKAGPFDLGTVVVRQALFIDPETAQVTAVSDPFPTILDGIPLDIQRIDVDLNRPGFTVNPTSCDPMNVTATVTGAPPGGPVTVDTQGAGFSTAAAITANVSSHFQVGGCQDIGFSPKLKIALTGKGKTKGGDHPTLTATLTDPTGQANILSAKVALPLSLALDPNNSNNVCLYATAQAVHGGAVGCPDNTIVGTAAAVTPLLDQPLTGNVYLVQGIRTNAQGQQVKTLPSLLVPLRGQIALDLRAQTSVSGGKLVTTFPTIPDAAVSKFTLKINGGKKGLLVITGRGLSICQKNQVGNENFGAQSGKTTSGNMTLSTPCGKPAQLKVLSHHVKTGKLLLRVRTSERGKVTVTGNGVTRFSEAMGAGTHRIQVATKLSPPTKSATKAKANARVTNAKPPANKKAPAISKVTVQVTPANARAATKTLTVRM